MPTPGVSSPGLYATAPSSGRPVGCRTGCLPPLSIAKFGQRLLYEYGFAQVGFGVLLFLTSFLAPHRSSYMLYLVSSHYGSRTRFGVDTILDTEPRVVP